MFKFSRLKKRNSELRELIDEWEEKKVISLNPFPFVSLTGANTEISVELTKIISSYGGATRRKSFERSINNLPLCSHV